jgi:uncharacterized protein YecT (DUF1311 family)
MMTICAGEDYKAADALLNQTYREIEKDSDADTLHLLKTAQRAWLAFRDAECAYATADIAGGSMQPMLLSMCLAKLTEKRTRQLRADNACQEGQGVCN